MMLLVACSPVTATWAVADVHPPYVFVPTKTAATLCTPPGSRRFSEAVPAAVSCAVPRNAAFTQWGAVALQKFTVHGCTAVAPLTTVAVSLPGVPEATAAAAAGAGG